MRGSPQPLRAWRRVYHSLILSGAWFFVWGSQGSRAHGLSVPRSMCRQQRWGDAGPGAKAACSVARLLGLLGRGALGCRFTGKAGAGMEGHGMAW